MDRAEQPPRHLDRTLQKVLLAEDAAMLLSWADRFKTAPGERYRMPPTQTRAHAAAAGTDGRNKQILRRAKAAAEAARDPRFFVYEVRPWWDAHGGGSAGAAAVR